MTAADLQVAGLSKSFGRHVIFENFSAEFPACSLTAVVGESGAGKSTLLNCIGMLEEYESGEITLGNESLTNISRRARRLFRAQTLAYLFQNYALIQNATVLENLNVIVPSPFRNPPKQSVSAALERVGLAGRENSPTYELSGGEQQRVALARILLKEPRLVLADEPTGALDQGNTEMVVAMLRELASEGTTVVVATHNPFVAQSADRLVRVGE